MNTLTLIKSKSKKTALHDVRFLTLPIVVLSMISVVSKAKSLTGPTAIVVAPILSDRHANTNYCRTNVPWLCTFIGLLYGEILLLHKLS